MKIIKFTFLGLATCVYRPWWKFWIRTYISFLEDNKWDIVCWDCKNVCSNFDLWFKWYKWTKWLRIKKL
jgi:hypothetical protein